MKRIALLTFLLLTILIPHQGWGDNPDMFLLPEEEGVYVYHAKQLPSGHGFYVYRQDSPGDTFIQLNDEPIQGARRADELRSVLGARYDQVLRFFDEETAGALFLALRTQTVERDFATMLYPEVASALGRLYIDETAPQGREVTYRIAFVDGTGNTTEEVYERSVLVEPTDLASPVITDVENEGRRVTIHWEYPASGPDDTDYVIQFYLFRIDQQTGDYQLLMDDVLIRNRSQEEYFISFESPVINKTEQYVITAVNFADRQSPPSEVYEYELIDNVPPLPVQNLDSRVTQEQWVSLTWDRHAESDVTGYHVYRSTDMNEDFDRVNAEALSADQTDYLDTTVVGGTAYYYYVTALDRSGNESSMGDLMMAQVLDLIIPPDPVNLTGSFNESTGGVDLEWDMEEEFTETFESFVIMRRREDQRDPGAFAQVNADQVTDFQYQDTGLEDTGFPEGVTLRYIIFSASQANNYSDTVSTLVEIPLLTPPDPPASITAVNDNGHRIQLSWNASPSMHTAKYVLYRKGPDEVEFSQLLDVPADTRRVRDEDLEHGSEYVYAVRAVDRADNESELSEPDTVYFRNFSPPRSVRNLQALEREAGVHLRWERVVANDLAGYAVYRAPTPTGRWELLHDGVVDETDFIDEEGSSDMWYRVRAVDTSGNESRPGTPVRPVTP